MDRHIVRTRIEAFTAIEICIDVAVFSNYILASIQLFALLSSPTLDFFHALSLSFAATVVGIPFHSFFNFVHTIFINSEFFFFFILMFQFRLSISSHPLLFHIYFYLYFSFDLSLPIDLIWFIRFTSGFDIPKEIPFIWPRLTYFQWKIMFKWWKKIPLCLSDDVPKWSETVHCCYCPATSSKPKPIPHATHTPHPYCPLGSYLSFF